MDEELQLVLKAQNGDSESMETLITRYMWIARSVARKFFLMNAGYDDLIEEGVIGIFQAIRDYKEGSKINFKNFVHICVKAQITDMVRKSTRLNQKNLNEAVALEGIDTRLPSELVYDPIHNYIEREGVENFYKKMETLFKPMQLTILKYYFEGYSYAQIAALVGIPTKKVDNILTTMKTKIKKNKELFDL